MGRATTLGWMVLSLLLAGGCTDSGMQQDASVVDVSQDLFETDVSSTWIRAESDGERFVLVSADGDFSEANAMAWYSTDGLRWNRSEMSESAAVGPHTDMVDVTHTGQRFVAVGRKNSEAAFWVSDDGAYWELIDHGHINGDSAAQLLRSVAFGTSGLVAVGWDFSAIDEVSETLPSLWRSDEGLEWTRVESEVQLERVGTIGDGFLAFGEQGSVNDGGAYVSTDGRDWVHLSEFGPGLEAGTQNYRTATVLGDSVVVIGRTIYETGGSPAIWLGRSG